MPAQTVIKVRRDTAANWSDIAKNPVLASGEIGLETDTKRIKFGDGTSAWNSLGYAAGVRTNPAATWTSTDPDLGLGEIGLETDTNRFKFGDGTTAWNSLPYAGGTETLNSFLLMGA
jgi:hypothetical protein